MQILAAIAFIGAGGSKLAGVPQMVAMLESVGLGQWFRYLTGGLEVVAAVLLRASALSGLGGLLVVALMAGAVFSHAFVIGGGALLALVLGLLGVAIVRLRCERLVSPRGSLMSR